MKRLNLRKINNKGFTLIELLAVIVILAIVMGVAASAVLNVMNDSRKNSLVNSAKSAADSFRTKYAEAELTNATTVLGINRTTLTGGTAQPLNAAATATALNITSTNYDLAKSWVYYDTTNSSFIVCLTANSTGSYYLATAIRTTDVTAANSPVKQALVKNTMWACSNDTHSW